MLTPEGDTYYGFNARVGGTRHDTLTLSFAPDGATAVNQTCTFTTAGTYTVSFPEGVMSAYGIGTVNPAFTLSYTVDPLINFTYSFDPADGAVASGFIPVTMRPGHCIGAIQINNETDRQPRFSNGTTDYAAAAIANEADGTVSFVVENADATATPGQWILTVPARYLYGLNENGERIFNPEPISYSLMVREAERFGYTVIPAAGDKVEFFKNITLEFSGENLKEVSLDPATGTPLLTSASGEAYPLEARLSGNYVIFTNRDGRTLPDGSLYAATRNESNEFIKISPATLTIERMIDIEGKKVKIANVWDTWKKAPIATDKTRNIVYYVTQKAMEEEPQGPRTVARYDFDSDEFTEAFITLPGTADGYDADWVLYGEGVSVDPVSGNIMLSAVEAGYGVHFSRNCIFEADPATGDILRSRPLENGYWFPAMALYPDFAAPEIDALRLTLPADEASFTLDVASATTIATGNPHLIRYTARTLAGSAEVSPADAAGIFEVNTTDGGEYEIELTADFQGKTTKVILSGISTGTSITTAEASGFDVYNLQGIRILTNVTSADLKTLPAGIYIMGGRKFVVR